MRILLVLLASVLPLAALDRITLESGEVISGRIVEQTAESVSIVDTSWQTQTFPKSEIQKIDMNVAEDKFLVAALGESNVEKKIFYLRKSMERYPKGRDSVAELVRTYQLHGRLDEAQTLLTNLAFASPDLHILRVVQAYRLKGAAEGRKLLDRTDRRSWTPLHHQEGKLLSQLFRAEEGQYRAVSAELGAIPSNARPLFLSAWTNLQLRRDPEHYRKTLASLAWLEERMGEARERSNNVLNLKRYVDGSVENRPPLRGFVETRKVVERPPAEWLRFTVAGAGFAMLGASAASAVKWVNFDSRYRTAYAHYLSATTSGELSTSSSSGGSGSGGGSGYGGGSNGGGGKNSSPDEKTLYDQLGSQGYPLIYTANAYAELARSSMAQTLAFGGVGALLTTWALLDPFGLFQKIGEAKEPMHLQVARDSKPAPALKSALLLGGLASLAACALTVDQAGRWEAIYQTRSATYRKSVDPSTMDYTYLTSVEAYRTYQSFLVAGVATGLVSAGALGLFLALPNDSPRRYVVLPVIAPGALGLTLASEF